MSSVPHTGRRGDQTVIFHEESDSASTTPHSDRKANSNPCTGRNILTLTGSVVRAPAGQQGFDADTVLTSSQARQLRDAGFAFCIRYLSRAANQPASDLTTAEARRILSAKLALMPVQHVAREGWVPTGDLGTTNGSRAAQHALDIGFPPGVNVWLDVEGIAPSVPSQDVIDYCNAWFTEVEAVGFESGLYVGANAILSADELFWRLKTKHYWHSLSTVPDIPHRGYQMFQSAVRHPLAGVDMDRNVTLNDAFGDSVLWLAPD